MPTTRFKVNGTLNDAGWEYVNTSAAGWPPSGGTGAATNAGVEKTLLSGNYRGQVALFRFDLSDLPDDATITGANLVFVQTSLQNNATDNFKLRGEYYDYGGDANLDASDWVEDIATSIFTQVELESMPNFPAETSIPLSDLSGLTVSGTVGFRLALSPGTPTASNSFAISTSTCILEIIWTRGTPVDIDFDAATENERTGTSDPTTFTHTPVGDPDGVAVTVVHGTSSTDHVVGVTYGGEALTRVVRATDTATEPGAAEIWFLGSGIPTGAQTVSVDLASATTDDIHIVCMTFTADGNKTEIVDSDSISENAASPSRTMDYAGSEAVSIAALYDGGSAPTSFTPNVNCEGVADEDFGSFYSSVIKQKFIDSSFSTFAIGGTASTDDVAYVAAAIRRKPPVFGDASQAFTAGVSTVARSTRKGASASTFTLDVSSDGITSITATLAMAFGASVRGYRPVTGALGQVFTTGIDTAGSASRSGAASLGLNAHLQATIEAWQLVAEEPTSLSLATEDASGLSLTVLNELELN